jgi:hypothetical protein
MQHQNCVLWLQQYNAQWTLFKTSCGIPNYVALEVISIHIILHYFWIQFQMKSLYEKESGHGLGVASVEECFDIVWLYSRLSCG